MSQPKNDDRSRNYVPPHDAETDFTKDPLKDKIGNSLRKMYDDVVNEPVPDEFLSLLADIDKKSK